jgi:hypothetical protein
LLEVLYDVLYAFAVVVGISAAVALAFAAAGAMHRRGEVSAAQVGSPTAIPSVQPTRHEDRELVLR